MLVFTAIQGLPLCFSNVKPGVYEGSAETSAEVKAVAVTVGERWCLKSTVVYFCSLTI